MSTITVKNWMDRDVTLDRDGFVRRWTESVADLGHLSIDHYEELRAMQARVAEIASYRFDQILEEQKKSS